MTVHRLDDRRPEPDREDQATVLAMRVARLVAAVSDDVAGDVVLGKLLIELQDVPHDVLAGALLATTMLWTMWIDDPDGSGLQMRSES